jgi:hypothetical protein
MNHGEFAQDVGPMSKWLHFPKSQSKGGENFFVWGSSHGIGFLINYEKEG